jgi:hypothetical protein
MNSVDISTTIYGKSAQIGSLSKSNSIPNPFNCNVTTDQVITLYGGNKFIATDLVLLNSSTNINVARDLQIWTGKLRTGYQVAFTIVQNSVDQALTNLVNSNNWIDASEQFTVISLNGSLPPQTIGTALYASLGHVQGAAATIDILIYGDIVG